MAIAKLALSRPGFDWYLGELAGKLHGPEMYETFKSHGPDPLTWPGDTREPLKPACAIDIKQCARCGADHDQLGFLKLANPMAEWTHWGTCPRTGEPITVKFEVTEVDEA